MNVLVTGGTGFVGSHLLEALVASGDTVRALVRPSSERALLHRLGVEPVVGDLEDAATLRDACRDCDVVYHAAARVDLVGSDADFHRTTVAGTQALVQSARDAAVRRFVYVSSCGVYHPDMLREGIIREDTPVREPPPWFRYGRAKLAAEQLVRERLTPPAEWVVLRLGYLYGPRNRAMKQYLYPLLASGKMSIIGRGDNEMAMVHVRDAVRAIVLAGRAPQAAGRVLIAAGNERVTQKDYFDALADGFGLPRLRRHVPYRLAYFTAYLAELMRFDPLGGVLQRAGVALTGLPQRINCEMTQQLLGWKPQGRFAEGIREACDWYAREYPDPRLAAVPERT